MRFSLQNGKINCHVGNSIDNKTNFCLQYTRPQIEGEDENDSYENNFAQELITHRLLASPYVKHLITISNSLTSSFCVNSQSE